MKKEKKPIKLKFEATFAELSFAMEKRDKFKKIQESNEETFFDYFIEQLEDKFSCSPILVVRVEDLLDRPEEVGNIIVLELFGQYEYEQEDIEAFLPIKFE